MKKIIILMLLINSAIFADTVSIENAYQRALNYEANVQSYDYQLIAKKQEIYQAKSRLYPKLNFSASKTLRGYKTNFRDRKAHERYYTLNLSAKIPVYHPENFNIIDQSRIKYTFTRLYLKQLKQDLAYKVATTYIAIIRAKNALNVAKAYVKANKIKYQQIKKKFDRRLANKMDLLEAKVTYEQSLIKVSSEKRNLQLSKLNFKNLTGIKDIKIPAINLEGIDTSVLIFPYKKEQLDDFNIEVKKSNLKISLSKKEIQNSKYGRYPKVDLSASISKYNAINDLTDYKYDTQAVLSLSIPILDGGYTKAKVEQSRYLLKAAEEDLKNAQRKAESQYDDAMVKYNNAKENIKLYKENIKSSKLYLYAVSKGYEHGLKDLIDVEDAKAKLFEAKFKLIDSVYKFMDSYTTLLDLYALFDGQKLKQLDSALFAE